jgi:signal transduction histidine kinase
VAFERDLKARRQAQSICARNRQFATFIRDNESAILASYAQSLERSRNPIAGDPGRRVAALREAAEIVTDVVEAVEAAGIPIDVGCQLPSWPVDQARPDSQLSPADSQLAAAELFNLIMTTMARHASDEADLRCFITAVSALNRSISRRMREATLAYTGYLLDRVHYSQADERRRIARELHDRLGEGLSVSLRQLDLQEIAVPEDSHNRTAIARAALLETMRRLRQVTSDLREEPVPNLEKALNHYLDCCTAGADVRLHVSGDETWAPRGILDEAFMVIREAIRNALTHGAPGQVLVRVDLAPHELCARIEDDGSGFSYTTDAERLFAGTGISSMRERAATVGGKVIISSEPGHGTLVELRIPLPDHRSEQSG